MTHNQKLIRLLQSTKLDLVLLEIDGSGNGWAILYDSDSPFCYLVNEVTEYALWYYTSSINYSEALLKISEQIERENTIVINQVDKQ